jgi:hypothetical protein
MTPQDIFDRVVSHLTEQGKRSMDERHCRYHNDDGLMCAVGVLIPKEDYFPEIDKGNKTIKSLIVEYAGRFPEWMEENLGLLSELQSVHDRQYLWENGNKMFETLESIAERYGVSSNILNKLNFDFITEKEETVDD